MLTQLKKLVNVAACMSMVIIAMSLLVDSRNLQAAEEEAEYLSADMCLTCHEGYDKAFSATKHGILFENLEDTGSKSGCEACHGPGGMHMEDQEEGVVRFGEIAPAESSAICLKCHVSDDKKNWRVSQHSLEGMACADCHSPHGITVETYKGKDKPEHLLKNDNIALCLSCHEEKMADINLPSHHPVKEGKVSCSDCHSQHDNSLMEMDRVERNCINCHQEKAGPFVYEHQPAADSCLACHTPHGSVNDDLLTLRQPGLCLQCHIDTPSSPNGHDISGAFKTCTNCHVDVHGSNKHQDFCASVFGCPYP